MQISLSGKKVISGNGFLPGSGLLSKVYFIYKRAVYEPKRVLTRHQVRQHLDLELPASRTVRNQFLLFIRHLVYDDFGYSSLNGVRHL